MGKLIGFNPRARVGRDDSFSSLPAVYPVSIHAPAWGATGRTDREARKGRVSIHAPAWGATTAVALGDAAETGFNPRARVGRDRQPLARVSDGYGFNPRARVGRDRAG